MNLPEFVIEGFFFVIISAISYAFHEALGAIKKELAEIKSDYRKEIQDVRTGLKERAVVAHERIAERDRQHKEDMKDVFALMVSREYCNSTQKLWQANWDNLLEKSRAEHEGLVAEIKELAASLDTLTDCVTRLANHRECD